MARFIVQGEDRAAGAIGIMQAWVETIEADTADEAREKARAARYAVNREHVQCYRITEVSR